MARRRSTWVCRRQAKKEVCKQVNPKTLRNCAKCGKPRPKTKPPAHRQVLRDMPYEAWVEKYGEVCGICGRKPTATRRLDRDHCHNSGKDRGLLCAQCNRALRRYVTVEWCQKVIVYLDRAGTGA